MSYGYEYTERGFGGGFDAMGGFGGFTGGGGGGGEMGGGGFMAEEKNAGRSEQKSRDRQSLIPLTVKQIINIQPVDDVYKVDDVELHMLKLVGTLLEPQEHSTNFTFRLNDNTGTIVCKQWIEKDASSYGKIKSLRDGVLVKVIGNLREYENNVHVLVYDVSPILDWNELTYHLADVMLTHCQRTKGPIPGSASAAVSMSSPAAFNRGMAPSMGNMAGHGINLHNTMNTEARNLNESIYQAYLQGAHSLEGLSFERTFNVLQSMNVRITMDQLRRGAQQLCEDGRLYTTIDDEHYRPTAEY
eukprot:gene284-303_t